MRRIAAVMAATGLLLAAALATANAAAAKPLRAESGPLESWSATAGTNWD